MSDSIPVSGATRDTKTMGEHALHLEADRTRDEVRDTLDEIGQRLTPVGITREVKTRAAKNPGAFVAVAAGVIAGVTGLLWFSLTRGRR
jgi:glucose-6-phosphate-specific signal transduction histidine kinase